jgi:hypothetical protein
MGDKMTYLLGYRGNPPEDPSYRMLLLFNTWKRSRKDEPLPNILIVPPEEVEEFKIPAEKYKLTIKPDEEFKIRHGKYHFALDYIE